MVTATSRRSSRSRTINARRGPNCGRRRRRPNPPLAVRKRRKARGRRRQNWWAHAALELAGFESGLPPEYVFTRRLVGQAVVYNGTVVVPEIGIERMLAIVLRGPPSKRRPLLFADGPVRSRHRFRWARPTTLCIWFGRDCASLRWRPEHRLVGLIDLARRHLLQESFWRAEEVWDAPEVHAEPRGSEQGRGRATGLMMRRKRLRDREPCWCGAGRYRNCHGASAPDDELAALGFGLDAPRER